MAAEFVIAVLFVSKFVAPVYADAPTPSNTPLRVTKATGSVNGLTITKKNEKGRVNIPNLKLD